MSSPPFEQFCKNELEGAVASLETLRKSARNWMFISFLPLIIGVLIFVSGLTNTGENPGGGFIFFAVVFFLITGIFFYLYNKKKKRYVFAFKEAVVRKIINYINPAFEYYPGNCISQTDYQNSGLFLTECDRYSGDDYVMGVEGETKFCFSELHTEHHVQAGKNSYWETIFKGLFFMADFNKNFDGRTFVWNENSPQLNFFSKIFSSFAHGLEKVKLESSEFEKRFIVYSNDQVEARYILSPSLMERMVDLHDTISSNIVFSFVNTNINVAIPINRDLFEPTIYSTPGLNLMSDYYYTVQLVFEVMKELNLNLRIWNKA